MALEDLTGAKFIDALIAGNPVSNDDRREGDDHIRGIKNVLRNTFPGLNGAVTATDEQLNAAGAISGGVFPGGGSFAGDVTVGGKLGVGGAPTSGANIDVFGVNPYVAIKGGPVTTFLQATSADSIGCVGTISNHAFTLWTNSTEKARLDAAGNFGIGVVPTARLDVGGSVAGPITARVSNSGTSASSRANLALVSDVGTFNIDTYSAAQADAPGETWLYTESARALVFGTASLPRMRIDATGNVGIGTNAPVVRAHAAGPGTQARFRAQCTDASGATVELTADGTASGSLGTVSNHPLAIFTNSAVRMTVDPAGKITQKDGLTLASDPGAAAGTVPIGGMVLAGAPGGTNINGLATINAATTPLTLFATGSGANGTVNLGTFRNCGALSSASTVALWVRIL